MAAVAGVLFVGRPAAACAVKTCSAKQCEGPFVDVTARADERVMCQRLALYLSLVKSPARDRRTKLPSLLIACRTNAGAIHRREYG